MASAGKEGLVVDTDTGVVREDHVLVQRSASAVLVLGFGPRADVLRRFACNEDDTRADGPFIERCLETAQTIESGRFAKARQSGLPRSVQKIEDPLLRRLAIAEALAKAGFDPDEPRDERGRWTREGGDVEDESEHEEGEAANAPYSLSFVPPTAASVRAAATEWPFGGDVALEALKALPELAARLSGPAAFLGVILIPTNNDLKTRGAIPDHPEVSFTYDRDIGTLVLSHDGKPYFATQIQNGLFHDDRGRIIGRVIDGTIALDPDVLPVYSMGVQTEVRAGSRTVAERAEPQLCPDPTPENINRRSEQALAYQEQISLLPRGLEVVVPGADGKPVGVDGCCDISMPNPHCVLGYDRPYLLEGKGEDYQKFMVNSKNWEDWYTGLAKLKRQMARQNDAVELLGSRAIWYFAEPGPFLYFRHYAEEHLPFVDVFYEKPRRAQP